ncbi:MAG: hypothetical protein Q7J12_08800, partial [Syntrophales bacterium]|nr:hypothetical protein [Syntrophales bacterium]
MGIFEDRHEIMTGYCSEEHPAPGFIADQCSTVHVHYKLYHAPLWEDIPEWKGYGAEYVDHPVNFSLITPDGKWVGFYNENVDPNQEKTAKLIARINQKDADTWLWLWDKWKKYWEAATFEWCFTPAVPLGQMDAMDRLVANPDAGVDPLWGFMSPYQLWRDLFESEMMILMGMRNSQASGFGVDVYGLGFTALLTIFCWSMVGCVKGGTHNAAHATQRVITENGGEVFYRSPVKKILIENGRARGIRLEDGTEIEAKKAVLSGVDPYQLVYGLVGPEYFDPKDAKRVKNLEMDFSAATWYTWALHEGPKYKAGEWDDDVKWSGYATLASTIDSYMKEHYQRRQFKLPKPEDFQLIVCDHSIVDPSRVPEGKRSILTEQYIIPAWCMNDSEWKAFEKQHAKDLLKKVQEYAPNMTWDNVIGYSANTAYSWSKQ